MKKILRMIEDKNKSTEKEILYQQNLEKIFSQHSGSNLEKLQDFPKYVRRQSLAIFLAKYEIFKKVLNIHGSIVECGVYLGGGLMSFAQVSTILEPYNHQRRIIGFDTFSGFTKLFKQDRNSQAVHYKKGGLAVNQEDFKNLQECIDLYDSNRFLNHIPKVELVRGDATKTIPNYLKNNPHTIVSLLYLDFDVYRPTRIAIENFLPRMPRGAIVVFDELNCKSFVGETVALLETVGVRDYRIERFSFEPQMSYMVLE